LVRKNLSPKTSRPQWKPVADPASWEALQAQFQRLADEESAVDPDRGLRLYISPEDLWDKEAIECEIWQYLACEGSSDEDSKSLRDWFQRIVGRDFPEGWDQKGQRGRPRRLVYALAGGISDVFVEDFKLLAIKAGRSLGSEPGAALETWLGYVLRDARKHYSKYRHGGKRAGDCLITHICEVSAAVCLRLAQRTYDGGLAALPIPKDQSAVGCSVAAELLATPQAIENTLVPKRVKKNDLSRYLDSANLTDRQYQCMSLKFEYGLPVSEIATELKLHRKTVDQHITSAQAKMQSSGKYETIRKKLAKNIQSSN
jgi:DNA-binding CsgD family transcriptional regulator